MERKCSQVKKESNVSEPEATHLCSYVIEYYPLREIEGKRGEIVL